MKRNANPDSIESAVVSASRTRNITLSDIEELETTLWMAEQLVRIRELVEQHGADEDMLVAIDYAIEENEDWRNPSLAADISTAGKA